jgi:hypothetical protein
MSSFNRDRGNKRKAGSKPKSNVCYKFQSGSCTRGEDCKFEHVLESQGGGLKTSGDSLASLGSAGAEIKKPRNQGQNGAGAAAGGAKQGNNGRAQKERAPRALDVPAGGGEKMPAMESTTVVDAGVKGGHITQDRFADLPISNESRRAMAEVFKYEYMTSVQSGTLPTIMEGHDCLAKAKTGTPI